MGLRGCLGTRWVWACTPTYWTVLIGLQRRICCIFDTLVLSPSRNSKSIANRRSSSKIPDDRASWCISSRRSYSFVALYENAAASALRKLGRNGDATAYLQRAAAKDPCDAYIHYKLGQHLRSTGSPESAVDAYVRVLELEPTHALAAFWLSATKELVGSGETGVPRAAPSTRLSPSEDILEGGDTEASMRHSFVFRWRSTAPRSP